MLVCEECHGGTAEYPSDAEGLSWGVCEQCERESNLIDCIARQGEDHGTAGDRLLREDDKGIATFEWLWKEAVKKQNRPSSW